MAKPEPYDLNNFISIHQEEFVRFELWIADELTKFIAQEQNLNAKYAAVIVDLDEVEPVARIDGDQILLRYNGRFFIPREDKDGNEISIPPDEWNTLFKTWFEENESEVSFNEEAKDLVKFTSLVPSLTIPEETLGEPLEEEPAEEAPEDEGEEPAEETDEGGEEPAEEAPEDEGGAEAPDTLEEMEEALDLG